MRRILSGCIINLIGVGLLAVIYATRPDAPVGRATPRASQPAPPARSLSAATIATGPAPNGIVAVKPTSADLHKAIISPEGAKRLDPEAPRAELAGEPRSVGWGDSYAVRLLNSVGHPMVVSEIVLIAYMADGTAENIAMGALAEPGLYRATVPTRRSAPINLQIHVSYGEERLTIPVRRCTLTCP